METADLVSENTKLYLIEKYILSSQLFQMHKESMDYVCNLLLSDESPTEIISKITTTLIKLRISIKHELTPEEIEKYRTLSEIELCNDIESCLAYVTSVKYTMKTIADAIRGNETDENKVVKITNIVI